MLFMDWQMLLHFSGVLRKAPQRAETEIIVSVVVVATIIIIAIVIIVCLVYRRQTAALVKLFKQMISTL
jgi:hypothetical protein